MQFPKYQPSESDSLIFSLLHKRTREINIMPKFTEDVSGRLNIESQIYLSSVSSSFPLSPYQENQESYMFSSEVNKQLNFPLNSNPSQPPAANTSLILSGRYTKDTNLQLV